MGRLKEKLTKTREGLFLWHQERSILEVTELAYEIMERDGVSKKELADRLKTSKGYITQLLDGTANMTLRKVSDLFTALGYEFHPRCARNHGPVDTSADAGFEFSSPDTVVKTIDVRGSDEWASTVDTGHVGVP